MKEFLANLPKNWAHSERPWEMAIEQRKFISPRIRDDNDQFLIAEHVAPNGSMSALLTFPDRCERDAGFVFRYKGENQAYLAGLGGWDSRYFVAKMYPEKNWKLIGKTGDSQSLEHETSLSLRVDFDGASIRLFHNDVLQLEVEDSTYVSGRMGLFASRAKVTFSDVQISQKTCFTVMPFDPEFDPVYKAVKQAAAVKDLACIRADAILLSRPVVSELVHDIDCADIVVIDLTGRNSNVYYEAGLAHALGKQYILIAVSKEALSFDVGHLNALFYGNRRNPENLQQKLAGWFDTALNDTRVPVRPTAGASGR